MLACVKHTAVYFLCIWWSLNWKDSHTNSATYWGICLSYRMMASSIEAPVMSAPISHRLHLLWICGHEFKLPRWPESGLCPESTASKPDTSSPALLFIYSCWFYCFLLAFLHHTLWVRVRHFSFPTVHCMVCNCTYKLLSCNIAAWILQPEASPRCPN